MASRRRDERPTVAVDVYGPPLPRSFYEAPVLRVARRSIGKVLVRATQTDIAAGRIVEAEAYRGPEDRAAHSYGGRRTARTEAMFGRAGHAYVFFVYGMHYQFNLVTGAIDEPHAVLIRALEPCAGLSLMAARRGVPETSVQLTYGPGKLCQALGIDRRHYGTDLCTPEGVYLLDGPPARVTRSPRVGIGYAGAWAKKPWRFHETGNPYVSRPPRASVAAP